ncbi:MAG: ATP12 family chaperone protein [Planktomarina sp.]
MSEWSAKRFWKTETVEPAEGGFAILLDGRNVKTPAKRALIAPTEDMAQAIAAEWAAQAEKIDPLSMPFTRAANAAIDKVSIQKDEVAAMIAEYGGSDLLCYRAERPQRLADRQAAAWDPLLDWAKDTYGVRFTVAQGIMHHPQTDETMNVLRRIVAAQGPYSLTALHDLVSLSGSLIMGLAVQQGAYSQDQMWNDSIIDDTFQMEEWGHDDDAFDVLQIKANSFANAARFQQLIGIHSHSV